jgi:hypothetical protein
MLEERKAHCLPNSHVTESVEGTDPAASHGNGGVIDQHLETAEEVDCFSDLPVNAGTRGFCPLRRNDYSLTVGPGRGRRKP